tara:strand:+ start:201 stop:1577 length:1377 start_codon:yes stop_codon:yes gene_type:complete
MPLILGTNSIKDTTYDVANSLRFNSGSSDHLNRTTSSGNRLKWTWSAWVKKTKNGADEDLFSGYHNSSNFTRIQIGDTGVINFINKTSGSQNGKLESNRLFRDNSAWYHFVIVWDSGNATAANRMRIYVNGVEETSFQSDTQPSQDQVSHVNQDSKTNYVGTFDGSGTFFNGYMAEVVLVDGQALDPTSFGEFDSDSPTIWKPKNVSGLTFGTNGFHLDFENASSLGADVSGNGNNFTVNNLTSIDQTTDTCTNNFATLNSLVNFSSGTFEEGNLKTTGSDDTISTFGLTKGKWYWEAQRTNTSNQAHFGIGASNGFFSATSIVSSGDTIFIRGDATYTTHSRISVITSIGSNGGSPATFTTGDILSFSLDLDSSTKNITIKKNDSSTLVNTDFSYDGSEPIFVFSRMNSGVGASFNFGNPINSISSGNTDGEGFGNFEFAPPSGYFALCAKNLAEYG